MFTVDLSPEPDPLLVRLAELKAHGASWAAAAHELGRPADELKALVRGRRDEWRKEYLVARRDAAEESYAEAMLTLRRELRADEEKHRISAAGFLLRLQMTAIRHRLKPRLPKAKGDADAASERAVNIAR